MPLEIKVKTFGMAQEQGQLDEILDKIKSSPKGSILMFPEYAAYTRQGSQKAFAELSKIATLHGLSIITTLNLPTPDLPFSDPKKNYNALFIFSRNGEIYSPQAKITPQSFEMRHLDKSYPKMDVTPYSHLNKTTLRLDEEDFTCFFFICSDLYVLPMFSFDGLNSDIICCPANFGNGAEDAAGRLIEYSVRSGLFKKGFFCNTYQNTRPDVIPLTVGVEKIYKKEAPGQPYDREEMTSRVQVSSAVYPDEEYYNFKSMLKLTRKGTFTVPQSRSLEKGLKVQLGRYKKIVKL